MSHKTARARGTRTEARAVFLLLSLLRKSLRWGCALYLEIECEHECERECGMFTSTRVVSNYYSKEQRERKERFQNCPDLELKPALCNPISTCYTIERLKWIPAMLFFFAKGKSYRTFGKIGF